MCLCFFFQAEDGIRDLVRSRGLGDVYKRQQNPVELEGTFPLPEAQLDRFLLEVHVDYPSELEEREIARRTTSGPMPEIEAVLSGDEIRTLGALVPRIPVTDEAVELAVRLARATRPDGPEAPEAVRTYVRFGAGPRGSQALVLAAKARAALRGEAAADVDDIVAGAAAVEEAELTDGEVAGGEVEVQADEARRGWVSAEFLSSSYPFLAAPVQAPPPLVKSVQVAQALQDFSPEQGYRSWYYLISESAGSLKFKQMPWDGGSWWRWCCDARYDPRMRISDNGMYPSRAHDVAREWVSPYEGSLRISGRAYKDGRGGNGVNLRIVHKETTVWQVDLNGSDTTGARFDVSINVQPPSLLPI